MEVSEALAQALPARKVELLRRLFLRGRWGKCNAEDRAAHAFRDGLYLLACYRCDGVRVHVVTDAARTMNRAVLADELDF